MTPDLSIKLAGRRVVASVSGGKDSAALSLWLTEQGIDHDRVFLDTGWESDITYEYLRGDLTRALGPIVEVSGPRKMEELVLKKGMFPSRVRRYCTQELKVFPMIKYLAARMDAGEDLANAVGIRAAESEARAKMLEWERLVGAGNGREMGARRLLVRWQEGFDCEVWRPLIRWTLDDVVAIHARHGLRPNPLYLKGASRVGCWPCIFSRKSEIKLIADIDPARIIRIRDLERRAKESGAARYAAKGETYESLGYQDPAWFQAPIGGDGACWPIDKVVEWSRTLRGGRVEDTQIELFAARDEGCMRWGLCETSPPGKDDE